MRKFAAFLLFAVVFLLLLTTSNYSISAQSAPVATETVNCDPASTMSAVTEMLKLSGDTAQDISTLQKARDLLNVAFNDCQPGPKWTAQQVVDAFKAAKLEVVSPIPETAF